MKREIMRQPHIQLSVAWLSCDNFEFKEVLAMRFAFMSNFDSKTRLTLVTALVGVVISHNVSTAEHGNH